eukprot:gb/GEZN01008269.1/.p1 GENE.gb/GEZN01008269.1/~~gb/GEZN01008269.1/.p1  ORF type:complete len:458 (+),score=54.67 gb/GEZN01008269.1/:82-1374(+)
MGGAWVWPSQSDVFELAESLEMTLVPQPDEGMTSFMSGSDKTLQHSRQKAFGDNRHRFSSQQGGAQGLCTKLWAHLQAKYPGQVQLRLKTVARDISLVEDATQEQKEDESMASLPPALRPKPNRKFPLRVLVSYKGEKGQIGSTIAAAVLLAMPPRLVATSLNIHTPLQPAAEQDSVKQGLASCVSGLSDAQILAAQRNFKSIKSAMLSQGTWMAATTKVAFSFSSSSAWKKHGHSGSVFSNTGPISQLYDASGNAAATMRQQKGALVGFVFEHGLSEESVKSQTTGQLRGFLESLGAPSEDTCDFDYTHVHWSQELYTCGSEGADAAGSGNHPRPVPALRQPLFDWPVVEGATEARVAPLVLLCSSESSQRSPGLIDGAVDAGGVAAREVLRFLSKYYFQVDFQTAKQEATNQQARLMSEPTTVDHSEL